MTNISDLCDEKLLQIAADNSIIDIKEIRVAIENLQKKEILNQHDKKIWQGSNGYWYTYVYNNFGKRRLIKRKTLDALENEIYEIAKEEQKNCTINDVFTAWITEKYKYGEIKKQSYDRYYTDYNRFFPKNHPICQKLFKNITEKELEAFIKETICKHKLSVKAYSGLATLIKGIFKYGKKEQYTEISITNFFGDLDLPKNMFSKSHKLKATQIYMEDEIPNIIGFLKNSYNIYHQGILLQFQTGLRIGELSALKKKDIKDDVLLIRRTEIKYRDVNNKWKIDVQEDSKTDAGYREVILTATAKETLNKILELNPNGEFLFMKNGRRLNSNSFRRSLERVCQKLNITYKSSHKIRRTYCTILLDSDVSEIFTAEQVGHKEVSTTRKCYYFSNKTKKHKIEELSSALPY